MFLSLDLSDIYYPFYTWAHEHIQTGRLPLISDLSYHGAPMPAVVIVGFLSPVLSLFHLMGGALAAFNALFIAPWALFLFGAYILGRNFSLSRSASLLLAFLWTYNGQRLAHLDHLNITWACAFFPWVFLALRKYQAEGRVLWLLLAGVLWGLNLLTGHPQIVFYEGLFLVFWAGWGSGEARRRWIALSAAVLAALWISAPLILHTAECLLFDGFHFQWNEVNRFYHSWTPLNFITLVFPWFFGKTQYDRQGMDYWWQYQFTEMQTALSIAGLFFILLFLFRRGPHRRWLGFAALFGILMAMGRFSPLYHLLQPLPVFSWFRDPARYWFLVSWALGLGAAFAWDEWFKDAKLQRTGRRIAGGLAAAGLLFLAAGWLLLTHLRPLLDSAASWIIQKFLLGDGTHHLGLADYMARLPEKFSAIAFNLDPSQPRVYLPLLFLLLLNLLIFFRGRLDLRLQKGLLLLLVFADLMAFRAPLGNAFYSPSDIPPPRIPAYENRVLTFLYGSVSPLPVQYGEMAYANMNYLSRVPTMPMEANPQMDRYAQLSELMGWFSWIYKDRDPVGFSKHPNLMRVLGLDLMVSDRRLELPPPFLEASGSYPFAYRLSPILPRAYLADRFRLAPWPDSIQVLERRDFNPLREAVLEAHAPVQGAPIDRLPSLPKILAWQETTLSLAVDSDRPGLLVLQRTFLPGWKARVNGVPIRPLRCNLVLTGVPLAPGKSLVELRFDPTGLRLGFFLSFLLAGLLAFHLLRPRSA